MSQSGEQHQEDAPAAAKERVRWESFWRIVAGLMAIIVAWIAWVAYQIIPRSVVTPLAYESQIKPIHVQQPADPYSAVSPQPAAAAAGAEAGAAAPPQTQEPVHGEALKLSTELGAPPAEKNPVPKNTQAGEPAGALPAAGGGAAKARP